MTEQIDRPGEKYSIESGSLWDKVTGKTAFARESGALKSIETEYEVLEQDGIPFVIRTLSNVVQKEDLVEKQRKQEAKTGKRFDPFLPYEQDLFVCDLSSSHFCLLNKFNVVDNHLLIVTRAFEEQTDLLNIRDFFALCTCMQEIDGLAFFNGGKDAGASQHHKHLQLIPFPFIPQVIELPPIEAAIAKANLEDAISQIPVFPFQHAIAPLNLGEIKDPLTAAEIMEKCYRKLLRAVGFDVIGNTQQQPSAYNFIATKNWMLIVPRSRGKLANISVNSLGFAGSLFVRDRSAWELLKDTTPIQVLTKVARII